MREKVKVDQEDLKVEIGKILGGVG